MRRLARSPAACLQVGLRKGQGDVAGAAELLQQYLATQATDWYAWEEAAELYLQIQVRCGAAVGLRRVVLRGFVVVLMSVLAFWQRKEWLPCRRTC